MSAAATGLLVALLGLAPPPEKVVIQTDYFGTITLPHQAHIDLGAKCAQCHGKGPIGNIAFTPRVAHMRCNGCHEEMGGGPTACRDCHVVPPPPEPPPARAAAEAGAEGIAPGEPAEPTAATRALADRSPPTPSAYFEAHRWPTPMEWRYFGREVSIALAAGSGLGPSLRVVSHEVGWHVAQTLTWARTDAHARTLGLLGAGVAVPLAIQLDLVLEGAVGFDALELPILAILPAVGARTALQWRPRLGLLETLELALALNLDLRTDSAYGRRLGGPTAFVTVGAGFALPTSPTRVTRALLP